MGGERQFVAPRTGLLLQGPILPVLLRLAVPNLLLIFVQHLVGLIEMFWVSRLGTDTLAGVSLVFPVLSLMQMMSAGAVGGGISSAVARAIGGGQAQMTSILVHHALAISLAFGIAFSAVFVGWGPSIYHLMGGDGVSLQSALAYSNMVFGGIALLWVSNSMASLLRGAGNVTYPAVIICSGAVVLAATSPLLIFGVGPFPRLGVAGAGLAIDLYYAVSALLLGARLISGRELVRLELRWPAFRFGLFFHILRVGVVSAVIGLSTTLTIALTNAVLGMAGPTMLAGFGVGVRLEYVIISITFGFGIPVVAMVGTCIGAGDIRRARRVAWTAAAIGAAVAEAVGLAAAAWPGSWLGLFTHDAKVIAAGTLYLRSVSPIYGFLGLGMLLYFASQGAGRMGWPAAAAVMRLTVAALGAWWSFHRGPDSVASAYLALAASFIVFGGVNAWAMRTWPGRPADGPKNKNHRDLAGPLEPQAKWEVTSSP